MAKRWTFYLSETRDREAAKLFLKKPLANADNRPPHVFVRDACGVIQPPSENYKARGK
jgi:transposase-like protein